MLIVKCISNERGLISSPDSLSSAHSFAFLKLTSRHSNWNLACGGSRCQCVRFSLCCFWAGLIRHTCHITRCMVLTHTLDELLASMSLVDSILLLLFFFLFHFALLGFSLHPVKSFFLSWDDFLSWRKPTWIFVALIVLLWFYFFLI